MKYNMMSVGIAPKILLLGVLTLLFGSQANSIFPPQTPLPPPEISGWVAWWKEEPAYQLIESHPTQIKSVSPVWYMIGKNFDLEEIGKVDKPKTVEKLKDNGVLVYPSLGSELSGENLSNFLQDSSKVDIAIDKFVEKLLNIKADGADIDLEGIKKEDELAFDSFFWQLSRKFKQNNLTLIATLGPKASDSASSFDAGQDLVVISQVADYVRIMTYDKHSSASSPGAIAPINWVEDVAKFSRTVVDKNKIVIGIPSYGYVWTKDNSKGLQFDEFNEYLINKTYSSSRDAESNELKIEGDGFIGYLSDSQAQLAKIEKLRTQGFNKFVIWHLGGMDEKFFEAKILQKP